MIKLDCPAPNIELVTDEKFFSLSNYRKKNIIVFFFPKADTSGCTAEAIAFSELKKEFDILNSLINTEKAISNIHKKQFDFCAEDLKNIHVLVKEIIGEDLSDDILDRIFSTFCIGK